MIIIEHPYIQVVGNRVRLVANIINDEDKKEMYFEVDKEYQDYLCTEVIDAFVIGVLNFAMSRGENICSDVPVSERLYYQLETYFIPTMKEVRPSCYKEIKIDVPVSDIRFENAKAVGTSASGGVDSFYSISRHTGFVSTRYRLTHLLIANQFNKYGSEEEVREEFKQLISDIKDIPENYGLELITMYTNHHEFLFDGFVQEYSLRICSYALALAKLFETYYVSSGVAFKEFGFANHDSDGFDIFNLALASTDSLTFYSSGGEVGRTEKIRFFSQDEFIQKKLKVCNDDKHVNCGKCEKCMRTMLSLDIIGELDGFKESFPLEEFKKRRRRFVTIVEAGYLEASADLLESINLFSYRIPLSCIVVGKTVVRWFHGIKSVLKKWNWLRDTYFKLKLDFILYGKERALVYRYGTKYEIKE